MNKHTIISFVKSFVRIVGFGVLLINIPTGVIILIIAEVIGVFEEIGA